MSKLFIQIRAYANRENLPIIPIEAKNLAILNEPDHFYKSILHNIETTRHRLALSALYLGTGPKELAIIEYILKALRANRKLDINIVLDRNRARRVDSHGLSSISLLDRISDYANARVNLIDSSNNSVASRLLRRYQRWNEIVSTYHAKLMIFDNKLILTGANLSDIYFENRQDRYVVLEDTRPLSDYLSGVLDKLNSMSPIEQIIKDYNREYVANNASSLEPDTCKHDSFIIPLFQHGPSKLQDKENFLQFLSRALPSDSQIHLSSGYFNPSVTISSLKLKSVLAPSEEANGFYNGRGLLKYVPRLYSSLYKKYLESNPQCELNLYERPDWSFHAKGLWVTGLDDFYIHMIGSSNFNHRSSSRDFETQLLLLTRNKELISKLEDERERLWSRSTQISLKDIQGLNWLHNMFANLLKSFL